MDSVRNFKNRWYIVQPSSQEAVDAVFDLVQVVDEDGEVCYNEGGNPEIW